TKKGKLNQTLQVNLQTNMAVEQKPDLSDIQILSSKDHIELEEFLFANGHYKTKEKSATHEALSPMVELLIQKRDGYIDQAQFEAERAKLAATDVRNDLQRYWYGRSAAQQYALDIRGGG